MHGERLDPIAPLSPLRCLSWLLYSIGLLVVGIKWDTSKVRWAALILMVGTAFKIFFMDLWRLGQLYRVASFIGLAAVLILVSFLYQRFLTGRDEKRIREESANVGR